MHSAIEELEHDEPFSLPKFTAAVAVQMILAFAIFYWVAPVAFGSELTSGWRIMFWIVVLGLPLSLFEYLYHRYLLHSAVLPFLGRMHLAHGTHHGLTSVKAPVLKSEPDHMVPVKSEYPVEEDHQHTSMSFPLYSISIFLAIFLVLLALPFKLIFPGEPIVVATMIIVAIHYSAYELWHAVMHLPFDRFWKPLMMQRRVGKVVGHVYSFHLMHHWRPTTNLAVVGFWGFAIWDHLFRTHKRPANIPLNGSLVNYSDAVLKKPLWPIALLDRWQSGLYRFSRKVESGFLRLFVRKMRQG